LRGDVSRPFVWDIGHLGHQGRHIGRSAARGSRPKGDSRIHSMRILINPNGRYIGSRLCATRHLCSLVGGEHNGLYWKLGPTLVATATVNELPNGAIGVWLGACNGHWAAFNTSFKVRMIDLFLRHEKVKLHACEAARMRRNAVRRPWLPGLHNVRLLAAGPILPTARAAPRAAGAPPQWHLRRLIRRHRHRGAATDLS